MVSTVTISTVSTVSTVAAIGLGGVASAVVSGTLMTFLAAKELVSPAAAVRLKRLSQAIMIGIVPLSIAFAATVVLKIAGILA